MIGLGPFTLDHPLGRGGMGEVWAARHPTGAHDVAIKFLTVESARHPAFMDAFRNEARAVAALDHPHIVHVYDYGEASQDTETASLGQIAAGTPWLAMEMVSGGTLSRWAGQLRWAELEQIILSLLDALAHAHARGVIHRDLKPGNVLVARDGEPEELLLDYDDDDDDELPPTLSEGGTWSVKLTDFGLAHAAEAHEPDERRHFYGGTPAYMAPEQFEGRWRDFGPWTDLYALGCTVFRLIRGHPPFGSGRTFEDNRQAHLHARVPELRPSMPVPEQLEDWIGRALAKDPARRFRRAADAAWALHELGPPRDLGHGVPSSSEPGDDTLILDEDAASSSAREATTLSLLGREATSEAGLSIASSDARPPPVPSSWRRLRPLEHGTLPSAGLGLWGLRRVPMVHRDAEQTAMWEALTRVGSQGRAELIALTGPAGSGKSRLAAWLCERAHEVGAATVLRAHHARVPGPGHGLGAMVGAFLRCQGLSGDEVLERVESIFRAQGVDHADEWQALTAVIDPEASDPGTIRFSSPTERYTTIRRLVQGVCAERPVVLWLDDVHYGLDALHFLSYLCERQARSPLPVLMVATFTDSAYASRPEEARLLDELVKWAHTTHLRIGPLEVAHRAALVEGMLGLEGGLARKVEEATEGNPLFAVQLVGDWVERGLLQSTPAGYRLTGEADLPQNLQDLWGRRVARVLSRSTQAEAFALEIAAILGAAVDPEEWLAACLRSTAMRPAPDPSQRLVDALLTRGLARTHDRGPATAWSFAHELLRDALTERAAASGRARVHHLVCARMLEDRAAQRTRPSAELLERIGRHLAGAGMRDRALKPLLEAVESHAQTGGYSAAEALLVARDELLQALDVPATDPRWGEGWTWRYLIAHERGDFKARATWLDRVEAAAAAQEWTATGARARWFRGRLARIDGDKIGSLTLLTGVERTARKIGDGRLVAETRLEIARLLLEHGELDASQSWVLRARDDYDALGDPAGSARSWQTLGEIAKEMGQHDESVALLRQSEALFEACGNRWGMSSCINSQGDVARYAGELDRAEEQYKRARGLLRAIGSASWCYPHYNLGLVKLARSESEAAVALLSEGMTEFTRLGDRRAMLNAHLALAACASMSGHWLWFDENLAQAEEMSSESSTADEDIARTAEEAGHRARGAGELDRAVRAFCVARDQWSKLDRLDEVDEVEEILDNLLA